MRISDWSSDVCSSDLKLNEVMAVADRVAVLRQGKLVAELPIAEADRHSLAQAMVGRPVTPPARDALAPGEVVLQMAGVSVHGPEGRPLLDELHLLLYGRDILGIADVPRNRQGALAAPLSAPGRPDAG